MISCGGTDCTDCTDFEFDLALIERQRSRMVPVVMEPRCRDIAKWPKGVVKGKLKGVARVKALH